MSLRIESTSRLLSLNFDDDDDNDDDDGDDGDVEDDDDDDGEEEEEEEEDDDDDKLHHLNFRHRSEENITTVARHHPKDNPEEDIFTASVDLGLEVVSVKRSTMTLPSSE
jgi:hypothetical protein